MILINVVDVSVPKYNSSVNESVRRSLVILL